MKKTALIFGGAALLALTVSPVFAQQPNTGAADPSIAQRKDNQQDRIANGIESGQLTAGETKQLETHEADINKEESNMRGGGRWPSDGR